MRFIRKIVIDNFQSHKHSEFLFKQGLNVIVGPSDSGKSAVVRALKWVLYNEPAGDFFIREGEKECSVIVEFNEGTVLQRYRSKSRNGYLLKSADMEEMRFEGIGSGVPQEISEITGIFKINLDSDSTSALNLGEQLEGPFLLSEKPSTRANAIGRLVGVDLIDDALRDVLKDIRNLNIRKKDFEESVSRIDEELSAFSYLDELKNKSKSAEQVLSDLFLNTELLTKLEKYMEQLDTIKIEKIKHTEIITRIGDVSAASMNVEMIENWIMIFGLLNKYDDSLSRLEAEKESLQLMSIKLQHLNECGTIEKSVEHLRKRLSELIQYYDTLTNNIKEQSKLKGELEGYRDFAKTENEIRDFETSLHQYNKLHKLSSEYSAVQDGLRKGRKFVERLDAYLVVEQDTSRLNDYYKSLINLETAKKALETSESEKNSLNKSLSFNKNEYDNKLKSYSELLTRLGKCPYCLSDISSATIDHLINNHLGGK